MTTRLGSLNEFCWMDLKTCDVAGTAAFSLWEPQTFAGWKFPSSLAGAPRRMVLTCEQPDKARDFYREVTGSPLLCADFVAALGCGVAAPRWELVIDVDDVDGVVARAQDRHQDSVAWSEGGGRRVVRLSSPEGLTFQVCGGS